MSLMYIIDENVFDAEKQLLKNRNLVLTDEIDERTYEDMLKSILLLNGISEVEPINLFISSAGGEVNAGMAIYDLMQWVPAPVHTVGMGSCASMAAILLMAGQKRYIFPHCWVMLHQCSGVVYGDTDTTLSRASQMEKLEKQILAIQSLHCNKPVEQIEKDTIKEKWFTAEEAQAYGIIDEIIRPVNGRLHLSRTKCDEEKSLVKSLK